MVALYCCYLAYSALQSEPHDYVCNGLGQRLNAASGTTLAVGMALALARCCAGRAALFLLDHMQDIELAFLAAAVHSSIVPHNVSPVTCGAYGPAAALRKHALPP